MDRTPTTKSLFGLHYLSLEIDGRTDTEEDRGYPPTAPGRQFILTEVASGRPSSTLRSPVYTQPLLRQARRSNLSHCLSYVVKAMSRRNIPSWRRRRTAWRPLAQAALSRLQKDFRAAVHVVRSCRALIKIDGRQPFRRGGSLRGSRS